MSIIENQGQQTEGNSRTRYILITQCLQNDFFLNKECKLRLPDEEVRKMLIGRDDTKLEKNAGGGRIKLSHGVLSNGPLGVFLDSVIGRRCRGEDGQGILHVINIRDWHEDSPFYDAERRIYGVHCEKGSWGADYIEGLEKYLDPTKGNKHLSPKTESRFWTEGNVRIYHIYSDSLFDFRPRLNSTDTIPNKRNKFQATELENILDILTMGSDSEVEELAQLLKSTNPSNELAQKANKCLESPVKVYIAVIGVCTDIKITTMLMGLRSRYDIPNLAVSDTLTASVSLERHLGSLNYAYHILNVEVVHGLNNLVRFLGGTPAIENELQIVASDNFFDYVSYSQDKQNVLAYENKKLHEYMDLTQQRAENVYQSIQSANNFLMWWGKAFLSLTLVGAILSAIWPGRFDWRLPMVTGGLSLIQMVMTFFSRPMEDLQKNVTNLATFKMILESHSLKTALARFHLTTPQTLRDAVVPDLANKQIEILERQIAAIDQIEECDHRALKDLGFGSSEVDQQIQKVKDDA